MLAGEQTVAREVPTTTVQEGKISRPRRSAIIGVVPGFRWYHRSSRVYSGELIQITLDIHLGNHSSNHSTQCGGELWVCSSMPRHLSHFGPLSSIASLTLDHVAITHFHSPTLQHTFRDLVPTVTNLRLLHPTACPTSLLRFITIFGNLQVITIHAPSWAVLDHNTPAVHCGQFRGTLYLSEFDDDSNDFISLLELHAAGTKRITISKCNFRDLRPLQWFLSSAAQSIQNLHVIVDENGERSRSLSVHPI